MDTTDQPINDMPVNEPLRLETPIVREEEKRSQELASGVDITSFTSKQRELAAVLARIKSSSGADLASIKADGMTAGELAAALAAIEGSVRDAEAKEILQKGGEAMSAALGITGGEQVSESGFFSALRNGLNAVVAAAPERGRGGEGIL